MPTPQSRWASAAAGYAARRRAFREAVLAELAERGPKYRTRAEAAYRCGDAVDPSGIALDNGLSLSVADADAAAEAFVAHVDSGTGDE